MTGKSITILCCVLLLVSCGKKSVSDVSGLPLCDSANVHIVQSDDNNLRIYSWNDGTSSSYNGGNHNIVQYRINGKIQQTDYESLKKDPQDTDETPWDCHGFELYTMHLGDRTCYLIECSYFKAAGWLGNRDISVYAFDGDKLVKQTLFRTSKELLSEIGIEYDAANYWTEIAKEGEEKEKDAFDRLFRYDDKQKKIYIPLVNNEISYGRVTKDFLLYQWDSNCFRYIGVEKAMK